MKVIATSMGFYKGSRVPQGQVFEYEGKKPAKWMRPVEGDVADLKAKKQAKPKGPETLLDIAKADSEAQEVKGADGLL